MSAEEFRDDVEAAIRRHANDLDAEDLRAVADDLEQTATQWEEVAL